MGSLASQPNEILNHIFSYLDARQRTKLFLCCKKFKSLLYDENYWKERCQTLFGIQDLSKRVPSWRLLFLRREKNQCVYHLDQKGFECNFTGIRICKICRQTQPRFKVITKTTALRLYKKRGINEEILFERAKYVTKDNPHYKRMDMYLFLQAEVEELAKEMEVLPKTRKRKRKQKTPDEREREQEKETIQS